MNTAWSVEDVNLVSSRLQNEIINPNESKSINLILTKNVTANDIGTVTNIAEILKSYNESVIEDLDSVEGNKNLKEDDTSSVGLIIGIRTGRAAIYIVLAVVSTIIFGVGIYFINKKVLRG